MILLRACILCLTLLFLCSPHPAYSETSTDKVETIEAMNTRIEKERIEKEVLEKKAVSLAKQLNDTKDKMTTLALNIQNNESRQKDIEQRIATLELKKSSLDDQFNKDKSSIAKLILALERIKRMPPEAMLARPDSPYKTAQSAMLMGEIIPAVNRHASKLRSNLETLTQVTRELDSEKDTLQKDSELLYAQRADLQNLIKKRQNLHDKTNNDIKSREVIIRKVSLEAQNLSDLVAKLKKEEEKEEERFKSAALQIRPTLKKPTMDTGTPRLPVSGIIRTSYGQKDDVGAKSKGLTIEGRKGAIIVAPMGGKIQFTGAFKRYGNIVIIEHKDGYHSLVAGLDDINGVVGDIVKSGEPIGFLPNSSLNPRPTLYYELRLDGTPVDPSVKFLDLG